MDKVPATELESRWPRSLVDLIDVLEASLKQDNLRCDARAIARKQAISVSQYLGGRQYYIPCGNGLTLALRDDLIYSQFNGRNMQELRQEHGLSQPQLYQIIARQRKIHANRKMS